MPTMPLTPARTPFQCGALILAATMTLAAPAVLAHVDAEVNRELLTQRQATSRDPGTLERHAEHLMALTQRHPDDPLVLAYAGAAVARRATATWLPWRKIGYAEDGLALIDKALALLPAAADRSAPGEAPTGLETQLVAANTFLALPSMFHRGARGKQLLDGLLNHPQLPDTPAAFRSAVRFLAGEQAVREDRPAEARAHFEAVLSLNGPEAPRARAAMQGLDS